MPVSTPGGIFTFSSVTESVVPAPLQVLQGSATTRPAPLHWLQVRATAKKPWVKRTSPAPPQVGQVRSCFEREPVPSHSAQRLGRGILTDTSLPKAASSKVTSRL